MQHRLFLTRLFCFTDLRHPFDKELTPLSVTIPGGLNPTLKVH